MNIIKQELQNATVILLYKESNNLEKEIADENYSILKKHCKAFAEFYFINEFNSSKDDCLTTEELFNEYMLSCYLKDNYTIQKK